MADAKNSQTGTFLRTLRHALGTIAERGGLMLRVVYDPTSKPRRVITAFFDRRARSRS